MFPSEPGSKISTLGYPTKYGHAILALWQPRKLLAFQRLLKFDEVVSRDFSLVRRRKKDLYPARVT